MRYTQVLRNVQKVLVKANSGNPTGLTGLFQHPNPRPALVTLYNRTLDVLKQKFPEHAVYRIATEGFTKERLAVVEQNEVIEDIEQKIGAGLIEELVVQANEELELAEELAKLKCWEELEEKPLEDQWTYFGKKV